MEPKLNKEGNEIDFDSNQRLETETLMASIFGSWSTSSSAWSTYKWSLSTLANSFPLPTKDRHHHAVLSHPSLTRLVAKEEETPPPPPEEEPKP
jgi:hypothetical protein